MSAPVYRAAQAAPPMPLAWGCVRVGALGVVGVLLQGTGACMSAPGLGWVCQWAAWRGWHL